MSSSRENFHHGHSDIAGLGLAGQIRLPTKSWRNAWRSGFKAGAFTFPTKSTTAPAQPCDDGDMTMFNGLLCFAGDERGCQGVIDAQDPDTGQWFRVAAHQAALPQRPWKCLVHPRHGPRCPTLSCEDRRYRSGDEMGQVGGQLVELGAGVAMHGIVGCITRPGASASLALTFDYLHDKKGMSALPHGTLRGTLSSWADWFPT